MNVNSIDARMGDWLGRTAGRHYELISMLLTLIVLLAVPLKIASLGYHPQDDALRHSAHALDDRPWNEIVVQREVPVADTNPGWDFVLRELHRWTGWDQEALLVFSMVFLCILYLISGLLLVRLPLAWMVALAIGILAAPTLVMRINMGRPYVVTICCMMGIMTLWRKKPRHRFSALIATILLFAVMTWFHGSWYLAVLIPAAFVLSGRFSAGAQVTGCWLAGSFAGGALTGHPFMYLRQQTGHAFYALGEKLVQQQLVGEFRCDLPNVHLLLAIGAVILIRMIVSGKKLRELTADPLFVLFVLGTLLGISVARFLLDWGLPAGILWMAFQWKELIQSEPLSLRHPLYGLGILSVLLTVFYCSATADISSRWTKRLDQDSIDASAPDPDGWLPDADGIVYSDSMVVFYSTYFSNPHAPWRYILGYEAGLMPEEDLNILRRLQWNHGIAAAFQPWVKKMHKEDRMIIVRNGKPAIPGLEWHLIADDTWIGRTPRGEKPSS